MVVSWGAVLKRKSVELGESLKILIRELRWKLPALKPVANYFLWSYTVSVALAGAGAERPRSEAERRGEEEGVEGQERD